MFNLCMKANCVNLHFLVCNVGISRVEKMYPKLTYSITKIIVSNLFQMTLILVNWFGKLKLPLIMGFFQKGYLRVQAGLTLSKTMQG